MGLFGSTMNIDFAYKLKNKKWFRPVDESEINSICSKGAEHALECLGNFMPEGEHLDNLGMMNICCNTMCCDHCQYEFVVRQKQIAIQEIRWAFESLKFVEQICTVEKEDAKSFVYFISDGENVKIGKAVSPYSRMKEMQVGNSKVLRIVKLFGFKTQRDSSIAEKHLHKSLSKYRLHGEWFNIKGLANPTGDESYDFNMETTLDMYAIRE